MINNDKFKINIYSISALIVFISLSYFLFYKKSDVNNVDYLQFDNNSSYSIIIASTTIDRINGLSGLDSLPNNKIMLFIFDEPGIYGIWMKDMKFPIDIIWLNKDKQIVYIEKDVSPKTYPKAFFPPQKSLYVIEANSGFSDKNGLLVGNKIKF